MTGVMRYEQQPASGWGAAGAVGGCLAVLGGLLAVLTQLPLWWLASAAGAVVAVPCLLRDALAARSVTGDGDGVTVRSRWRSRPLTWEQLRRVRGADAGSTVRRADAVLEHADGTLVVLPPGMPGGTVEGWRQQVGGARPDDDLPQTWVRHHPSRDLWPVWAVPMLGQLVLRLLVPDVSLVVLLALMTVTAAALLVLVRRRPTAVTADVDGLRVRELRERRIPWSRVQGIEPVDRFDTTASVELTDGSRSTLPGVPLEVAARWRALAEGDAAA